MSDDEVQTAEAGAEAPATDYTAEMSHKFDELNPLDELSRVPNEAQVAASQDYSVSEEPTESTEATETTEDQTTDGVKAPASLNEAMRRQWGALPREAQQWISEREAQAQQKITEQGQQLSELQRGAQASMPHLEHVERIARETRTNAGCHTSALGSCRSLPQDQSRGLQFVIWRQAHGVDLG